MEDLVLAAGKRLGRKSADLEPFIKALEENWYDNLESIAEATPEDLVAVGLPRKLAVELVNDAAGNSGARSDRSEGGKSKSKGKSKDKGKDKDKGKGKSKDKGKDRYSDSSSRRYEKTIELEEADPGFNLKGALLGERGKNMHHIQDATGAKLHIEGQGNAISIVAGSYTELDRAIRMVNDLVRTVFDDYDDWLREQGRGGKSKGKSKDKGKDKGKDKSKSKGKGKEDKGSSRDRVREDMDKYEFKEVIMLEDAKPEYGMRSKIIGDKGKNVHHIQDATGARLYLDCDTDEGMKLHISAPSDEDLQKAMKMAHDLIGAVYDEYEEWLQQGGHEETSEDKGRKSSKGKGKGKKDKEEKGLGAVKDGEFKEEIPIDECEAAFNFKGRFIGDGGRYVHHIQDETKARLWLVGEDGNPMVLHISANSAESLAAAQQMANDLLDTVYEDYTKYQNGEDVSNDKPSKSRGKGKSKKGKKKGDDGPPAKRQRT